MDERSRLAQEQARRAHEQAAAADKRAEAASSHAGESCDGAASPGVDSQNAQRLRSAGYLHDPTMQTWSHRRTARAIDAAIAEQLTHEQLTAWLGGGPSSP